MVDRTFIAPRCEVLDKLLVGTFALVLATMMAASFCPHDTGIERMELRRPAEFPALEWTHDGPLQFPPKFETWFDDHLGFRSEFFRFYGEEQASVFQLSAAPNVILGDHKWLYWAPDGSLEDYRGLLQLSRQKLDHCRLLLQTRQEWLAANGIQYLCVVAPDKHTVYPEFVPRRYTRVRATSRLDQIEEYLRADSHVRALDLRRPLWEEKRRRQIYYRGDTHWNSAGALAAYHAITGALYQIFPPEPCLTEADLKTRAAPVTETQRYLALDAGLGDDWHETDTNLSVRSPHAVAIGSSLRLSRTEWLSHDPVVSRGAKDRRLRALVFGDSFFTALRPFLSENFRELVYVHWQCGVRPRMQAIRQFHPDIVVDERVERYLDPAFCADTPDSRDEMAQEDFDLGGETRLTVSGATQFKGLTPLSQLVLQPGAASCVLHSTGTDPYMLLPALSKPGPVAVRVAITSPIADTLEVFYTTKSHPDYQSFTTPLVPGYNECFVEIPAPDLNVTLRLDPAMNPGDFVLHSIEARALPAHMPDASPLNPPKAVPAFSGEQRLLVNGKIGFSGLECIKDVEISSNGLECRLKYTGPESCLALPPFSAPGPVKLRIAITSGTSAPDSLRVFYSTLSHPAYSEQQSVIAVLRPGYNDCMLELAAADLSGRLRLNAGTHTGEYVLHSVEARAAPER